MKTFVAFFEIPAINMERAVQFYGTVFGEKLEIVEYGEFYTENMDESLAMVRKAGGKIATEPCETCEGSKDYFAYFLDTEGNRIGLFTRNIHPGE